MRVDAEDIRYFETLARVGTLTRAGEELGVDHTTVGRRVKRLESALGQRLFKRDPGGWRLAPAGESLLPAARMVVAGASAFSGGDLVEPGPVEWTVLAPDGFSAAVLAPHAAGLVRDRNVVLRLMSVTSLAGRDAVDYDVAVVRAKPTSTRVRSVPLALYEVGLFATRSYLDTHDPVTSVDDLAGHVIAWWADDALATVPDFASAVPDYAGLRPRLPDTIRLQSNNLWVHEAAALADVGLALLPCHLAGRRPELLRVLPDELSFRGQYWAVFPAGQLRWDVSATLLAFLREAVRAAGLDPAEG